MRGINWWESGAVTALTILFLGLASVNMGSVSMPSSAWLPPAMGNASSGEAIHVVFDLGTVQPVKEIYIFLGDAKRTKFEVYGGTALENWELLASYDNNPATHVHFCSWDRINVGNSSSRFLKFVFGNESDGKIGELLIISAEHKKLEPVAVAGPDAERLADEQEFVQLPITQTYGAYFDEMYFVRTAQELLNLEEPYEWTHPPLGKLIIAGGILVFGMNPFGWRIFGVLAAAAMIPILFLFGRRMFNSSVAGFIAAFLLTFDFMHFSLARLATGEIYILLFSVLMFYFAFEYFSARQAVQKKDRSDEQSRPSRALFLSILFFGLCFAVKWTAIFGLVALLILVVLSNVRERWPMFTDARIIVAGLFASAALYIATYIPYMCSGQGHALLDIHRLPFYLRSVAASLSGEAVSFTPPTPLTVFDLHLQMLGYHAGLEATHPFSSPWWSWPLMLKPLWLYVNTLDGAVSTIVLMGNPALWWGSIPALVMIGATLLAGLLKKAGESNNFVFLFICIPFLLLWLPYALITRVLFIYHFVANLPFMIFAVTYWLHLPFAKNWASRRRGLLFKWLVVAFLVLNSALFILFYPVLSGYPISYTYKDGLRWLSGWIF